MSNSWLSHIKKRNKYSKNNIVKFFNHQVITQPFIDLFWIPASIARYWARFMDAVSDRKPA